MRPLERTIYIASCVITWVYTLGSCGMVMGDHVPSSTAAQIANEHRYESEITFAWLASVSGVLLSKCCLTPLKRK